MPLLYSRPNETEHAWETLEIEQHNLEAPWARVKWAEEGLKTLSMLVFQYQNSGAFACWGEDDPSTGEVVVYVETLQEPPAIQWAPLIGAIVHHLRSALDHLIWILTERESGPAPPHPIPHSNPWRNIGFPIVKDGGNWPNEVKRKLWGVNPEFQRGLEVRQPFMTNPNAPERERLYILKDLWDIDKHRHPLLVSNLAAHPKDFQIPTGVELPDYVEEDRFPHGPFTGRTEIRRYKGSVADRPVDNRFMVDIAFADGPPAFGGSLMDTLSKLREEVVDVLEMCTAVGTG